MSAIGRHVPRSVVVAIPVLNGADTLGQQLEALARQSWSGRWRVVVADNGSTDGTRELVEGWRAKLPGLELIDASAQPGSSHARNAAVAATHEEFIAFCDADDEADEGWLAGLVAMADRFDFVTGRQEVHRINPAWAVSWRPPRATSLPNAGFLPFAPSCNLGVWRDVFVSTGGFLPRYRQAHDVDFSWRAQLAGYQLGFAPDAVMHYRYRTSLRSVARQAYAMGFESTLLYRDYAALGLGRRSYLEALRTWAWLPARAASLARKEERGTWVRRLGESAGRLAGCIEHRVICP